MAGATWNIEIPTAEYVDRDYPRLEQLINEVRAQPRIALDTETTGLNTWKDMPLFWSLAWPGRRMTLHASVMPLFQEAFDDPRKYWYFANAKFDLHMTANYGCPIQGHVVDVQVMHALLHDDRPHALKSIAEEVKGWRWSDFKDTFRPRPGFTYQDAMMEMFHADRGRLVEYAANDAYATFEIGMELDRQLHRERTYSLYPDLYPTLGEVFWRTEMPFTRVLWKMERKGIKLDFERAERTKEPISQRMAEIEKRVAQLKGASFNLGSRPDLIQALVVEEGLRPLSYTKGGKSGKRTPSLDEEFFKAYRNTSELASLKYEYDSIRKVKSTFIDGLLKFADPNQRVHTSYKQDTARCMPAGELVLTSRGYIPVETVLVGDTVITHTGQRRKVTETSTHAPKPIYTVTTSNGLRLRTTGNHEYRTKDSWIRADQLVSGTPLEAHSDAEEWRTIAGWSPFQVSSWGRVRHPDVDPQGGPGPHVPDLVPDGTGVRQARGYVRAPREADDGGGRRGFRLGRGGVRRIRKVVPEAPVLRQPAEAHRPVLREVRGPGRRGRAGGGAADERRRLPAVRPQDISHRGPGQPKRPVRPPAKEEGPGADGDEGGRPAPRARDSHLRQVRHETRHLGQGPHLHLAAREVLQGGGGPAVPGRLARRRRPVRRGEAACAA
jgi:hypothetical protein